MQKNAFFFYLHEGEKVVYLRCLKARVRNLFFAVGAKSETGRLAASNIK